LQGIAIVVSSVWRLNKDCLLAALMLGQQGYIARDCNGCLEVCGRGI